ncbi:CHAT domain-containing protein [Amycolatopsis sp. cmx-4-68]|uniref:CHAT domain-containing protein n=1 Tax=Amycolatopsis sp. cmx-4-68 TaxID=2790938 RepID=UPI00397B9F0C
MPAQIPALRGNKEFSIARLEPGAEWSTEVRVRPLREGQWEATSTNFSFRDRLGNGHRVTDFKVILDVDAKVETPLVAPPRLEIELATTRLACGEWDSIKGEVLNTGGSAITRGRLILEGPFSMDPRGVAVPLGRVAPGEREPFEFHLLAEKPGRAVPVFLSAVCSDGAGGRVDRRIRRTVTVGPLEPDSSADVRILYLSANPTDTERLDLDIELREVRAALRQGAQRDRFELHERGALRVFDLTQALLDFSPRIVHLSGHATEDGRFLAETAGGTAQVLSIPGLAALFEVVSDTVECVIVNACHSAHLAEALAGPISYVIGMRSWLGDQSAIHFSVAFYQALAAGRSIETAFQLGRAAMALGDEREHGREVPVLFHRP